MRKTATIHLRCQPEEKQRLVRKAEQADLSLSAYLMKAGLDKELVASPFPSDQFHRMYRSFLPTSSNLNQIAKKLNTMREPSLSLCERDSLLEQLQLAQERLHELIGLFSAVQTPKPR